MDEQSERFRQEAQRRFEAGRPSAADEDAELDAMVRKSIRDHGA